MEVKCIYTVHTQLNNASKEPLGAGHFGRYGNHRRTPIWNELISCHNTLYYEQFSFRNSTCK